MEFKHEPVLLREVADWMAPRPDGVYCDGTLGGGGHSGELLRLTGGRCALYGIDRDMTAPGRLRGVSCAARQLP